MFVFHPFFAVLFASIPFIAMLVFSSTFFDKGENFQVYQNQVVVTDSQLVFGDRKSNATIAVIGTIKNNSPISWKEIHFHVDFFDGSGKRIDVGETENYEFFLAANGTSSFKISFPREFPEANYAREIVRVVAAKDARATF
jgi:hypothetical protein